MGLVGVSPGGLYYSGDNITLSIVERTTAKLPSDNMAELPKLGSQSDPHSI
jgi:hypothetical protein